MSLAVYAGPRRPAICQKHNGPQGHRFTKVVEPVNFQVHASSYKETHLTIGSRGEYRKALS